jgi:hypothetical protein
MLFVLHDLTLVHFASKLHSYNWSRRSDGTSYESPKRAVNAFQRPSCNKLDLLKVGKKKPISLQPARCEKPVVLPM